MQTLLAVFAVAQAALGTRSLARIAASRAATRIPTTEPAAGAGSITILVPVFNEEERLGPALEGLSAQGPWVREILVVDGGSTDRTRDVVERFARADDRIRWLAAAAREPDWNGKIWNLREGLRASDPAGAWILTIDADVRPAAGLSGALVAFALQEGLDALSVATRQLVDGFWLSALHPAMLATLVYRFGVPGRRARSAATVLANGQCFLARRSVLERTGALEAARSSRCEDITIARRLVRDGFSVGFFESDEIAAVRMYGSAAEAWLNWPRSLPARDASSSPPALALALAEVALVQALPLYVVLASALAPRLRATLFARVNVVLFIARLGTLFGMRRAYEQAGPGYWFSPLLDGAVALRLIAASVQAGWRWRGVELVVDRAR